MTDRQLLEDAARAAGPDIFGEPGCYFRRLSANHSLVTGWSPLTDDGDEARLEAALQMHVIWQPLIERVIVGRAELECQEPYGGDLQAARRRAGVRAAAEIGRKMREQT